MTSVSNQKRRRKLFVDCTILHRKYTKNVDQKHKIKNPWKTSEKPLKNLWFLVFEHIRNMATRVRFSRTSTFFVQFRCYFYLSIQKTKRRMKTKKIQLVQIRTFRFKWCKIRKSPCASDLDKNINSWQMGNLDPELPMMQLFLQTLLPWNDVRRDI